MVGFEFATTHRVLVEAGAAARLPELCQQLGASRVMLVTDPGIRSTPLLGPVEESFRRTNMPLAIFDKVSADPADSVVLDAAAQAKDTGSRPGDWFWRWLVHGCGQAGCLVVSPQGQPAIVGYLRRWPGDGPTLATGAGTDDRGHRL